MQQRLCEFPVRPNGFRLRQCSFEPSPRAFSPSASRPTRGFPGRFCVAWDAALGEPLLLAAEQHDIGWLDWESAPTFNPQTGRPHLFREVGAAAHSPMWRQGVERALGAWGAHVALLVSRHGGVIYRRYADRHRMNEADAAAARAYLEAQAPLEAAWAKMLGLEAAELQNETTLVALATPSR